MDRDLFLQALSEEIEKVASEQEEYEDDSIDKLAEEIVEDFFYTKLAEELIDEYLEKMADEILEAGKGFDSVKRTIGGAYNSSKAKLSGAATAIADKTRNFRGSASRAARATELREGLARFARHAGPDVAGKGQKLDTVKALFGKGKMSQEEISQIRSALKYALKGAGKTGALYAGGAAALGGAAYGAKKLYDKKNR